MLESEENNVKSGGGLVKACDGSCRNCAELEEQLNAEKDKNSKLMAIIDQLKQLHGSQIGRKETSQSWSVYSMTDES